MGILSFFLRRQLVSEYQNLRDIQRALGQELLDLLPRNAMLDSAKKLGLRKGKKTIILRDPDEMAVIMDYSLYSFRFGGKTIIERYREKSPPPAGSDKMLLLEAMERSHYSVFMVKDVRRKLGVTLYDLIRNRTFPIIDLGLGSSAVPGTFFGGRILPLRSYCMTSGAFLPLRSEVMERRVIPILERFLGGVGADEEYVFSPSREAAFSTEIIRAALKSGAKDYILYADSRR